MSVASDQHLIRSALYNLKNRGLTKDVTSISFEDLSKIVQDQALKDTCKSFLSVIQCDIPPTVFLSLFICYQSPEILDKFPGKDLFISTIRVILDNLDRLREDTANASVRSLLGRALSLYSTNFQRWRDFDKPRNIESLKESHASLENGLIEILTTLQQYQSILKHGSGGDSSDAGIPEAGAGAESQSDPAPIASNPAIAALDDPDLDLESQISRYEMMLFHLYDMKISVVSALRVYGIVVDEKVKMRMVDLAPLVAQNLEKAYWDTIKEQISKDPADVLPFVNHVGDLRDILLDIAPKSKYDVEYRILWRIWIWTSSSNA